MLNAFILSLDDDKQAYFQDAIISRDGNIQKGSLDSIQDGKFDFIHNCNFSEVVWKDQLKVGCNPERFKDQLTNLVSRNQT